MSKIRVISGRVRGFKLKNVPGVGTRPITDRVKENLFNILGDSVIGTNWLDLFAGTGQVGIEALSRGAIRADFVDSSPAAIRTIKDNLRHTQLETNAKVIRSDSFDYLKRKAFQPYDYVFVAPPQYKDLWRRALHLVDINFREILSADGLVIVQIDPVEYGEQELRHLKLQDQRKYGRTMICFFNLIG